ncbi:PIR protein [Plasmodium vivax]|uniref:VIR protein n=1 Tax=Plasmodium vivax TaxID=5855 RepID=A0A565A542_PLAVI|nr:PIR protein [Plasmodium vivax]
MESSQQDPGYLSHHDYVKAKHEYYKTLNNNADENRFEKIIKKITNEPYKRYLDNKTLINLHNVLSNDHAFIIGIKPQYCSYINFRLNKEVQDTKNNIDASYINIFQEFSDKFCLEKSNNLDNSCKKYIFNLGHETINIMDILYGLYDEYDKIKSLKGESYYESCNKFLLLAKNHNDAIDKYYRENISLYHKFDNIKKLIDNLKAQSNYPCIKEIYLNQPKEVIKKIKEEEQRAIIKKRQEEEAKQAEREREQREREQRELQEQREKLKSVLAPNGDLLGTIGAIGTRENDVLSSVLQSIEDGLSENSISSRGQQYIDRDKFTHSQTPYTEPLWGQREEFVQSDVKNLELESNKISQTDTSGAFGSLQNSISSFIRDVEPGPVLGVSGGMGVLFLLFKYTPVGSFFGGRRGRFRQIPSSFRKFPPGEFPIFQENDVGYIGYGAMNASPFAE